MTVYSPITNDKLINYELANYFSKKGYNIFNKNDKFYKDICSPAYINKNDITLKDRYTDIYPHEIQICPKDCECTGINLTAKIFICDCEIKGKGDYEYELMSKDEIFNFFKDYNNLIEYFSDMFNYKIMGYYKLVSDINNYKTNIIFFNAICSYIISLLFLIFFRVFGYKKIRKYLYDNLIALKNLQKETYCKKENKESKNLSTNEITTVIYKKHEKIINNTQIDEMNNNYENR